MEQITKTQKNKRKKLWLSSPLLVIVMIISFTITYNSTMNTISHVESPYAEWEMSILDGFEDTTFSDIEFFNITHGWMSGWGARNVVLATRDGGESWGVQLETNRSSLRSISVLNSSNIWASSSGCLYHSIDGGESWMKVDIPIDLPSTMRFYNETYGWAGSYKGLVKTTDGGMTWYELNSWPSETFPNDFSITQSTVRVATSNGVYISNDFGEMWYIEHATYTEAISIDKDNISWAVHPFTVSKLHGNEWIERLRFSRLLNSHSPSFDDIEFIDENHGWVAGRSPAIAYTPDGGVSWYEQEIHRNPSQYKSSGCSLMTIEVFNESYCWAAGWRGVVARTTTGNLLGPKLYTGLYLRSPLTGGGRMVPYEPLLAATTLSIMFGIAFIYGEYRFHRKRSD
jgi:photosystem II stability/assembly factor-like uncharacterized protein